MQKPTIRKLGRVFAAASKAGSGPGPAAWSGTERRGGNLRKLGRALHTALNATCAPQPPTRTGFLIDRRDAWRRQRRQAYKRRWVPWRSLRFASSGASSPLRWKSAQAQAPPGQFPH